MNSMGFLLFVFLPLKRHLHPLVVWRGEFRHCSNLKQNMVRGLLANHRGGAPDARRQPGSAMGTLGGPRTCCIALGLYGYRRSKCLNNRVHLVNHISAWPEIARGPAPSVRTPHSGDSWPIKPLAANIRRFAILREQAKASRVTLRNIQDRFSERLKDGRRRLS